MNTIEIDNAKLSTDAIDFIESMQEDNNEGFNNMEEAITGLLVEVIQQRFGDERRDKYITHLADVIDFIHCLKS